MVLSVFRGDLMGNSLRIQNFGKSVQEVRKRISKAMKYSLPSSGLYNDAPFDEGWRISSVKLNKVQSKSLGSKIYDIVLKKTPSKKKKEG